VGILGVILSLGMGHYSVVTWNIVAVLVTASIGIPTLILAYEKVKSEEENGGGLFGLHLVLSRLGITGKNIQENENAIKEVGDNS